MSEFWKGAWKYVLVVLAVALVAGLGTLFVNLGTEWFDGLAKPAEFVPDVLIPIVWTVIYLSFAVVLCVWISKENLRTRTLVLLILNGGFNVLWCLLFFTLNSTLLGLVAIILNLILAGLLIFDIYGRRPIFAYILSIYPIWLAIATCLNLATWILN